MEQNLKSEFRKSLWSLALFPHLPFHSISEHSHTKTWIQAKDLRGLIQLGA